MNFLRLFIPARTQVQNLQEMYVHSYLIIRKGKYKNIHIILSFFKDA